MLSVSLLCLVHQPGRMKHGILFSVLFLSSGAPHATHSDISKEQPRQLLTTGPGMCAGGEARQKNRTGSPWSVSTPALSPRHPRMKTEEACSERCLPGSLSARQCCGLVQSCCVFRVPKYKGDWWARMLCQCLITFNVKSRWQPTQSPIQWACMPLMPYHSGRSASASCMAWGNKTKQNKRKQNRKVAKVL